MVDTPKKDTEKSTTAKVDDGEKKEEPKEEERVLTIEEGQSNFRDRAHSCDTVRSSADTSQRSSTISQ